MVHCHADTLQYLYLWLTYHNGIVRGKQNVFFLQYFITVQADPFQLHVWIWNFPPQVYVPSTTCVHKLSKIWPVYVNVTQFIYCMGENTLAQSTIVKWWIRDTLLS